jgi:DNA-binding transcriptional regulator YhcF (GntR family)
MDRPRAFITETLRQRLLAALHLGTVAPGGRLPSLRRAGAALRCDPRVVLAAYRQLADEGLVVLRKRSGVFAAPPARSEELLPEVGSWVVEVLLRGLARGMPPVSLRRQIRVCLDTVRVRAACLECNDDQIHALGGQLHDDYGFTADGIDLEMSRAALASRIAEVDLVVTTRFHAAEAQRLARRLRRPLIVVTLDQAFVSEVRRMLAAGSVWWICTDPRFVGKLARMFPGVSLRPIVLGRDALDQVPPGAPVYATRRAAERLPPGWHAGGVVTVPRAFSAETARALLTFLVRRNLEVAGRPPDRPRPRRARARADADAAP